MIDMPELPPKLTESLGAWVRANWERILVIAFMVMTGYITLTNTVKITADDVKAIKVKVEQTEIWKAVHDNEHKNLMATLAKMDRKLDALLGGKE